MQARRSARDQTEGPGYRRGGDRAAMDQESLMARRRKAVAVVRLRGAAQVLTCATWMGLPVGLHPGKNSTPAPSGGLVEGARRLGSRGVSVLPSAPATPKAPSPGRHFSSLDRGALS